MVFVISGIAFSGPVAAASYDVNSTMDNSQIQGIIDNAGIGDTINFLQGVYNNVKLSITSTINLIGSGAVLNSNGSAPVLSIFGSAASGTNVTGLTINGNGSGYGINASNASGINVVNNVFNHTLNAIYFTNVNGSSIRSNGIYNNSNVGVTVSDSGNLTSSNNILIDGNTIINSTSGFSLGGSGFNVTNNFLDMFNSTATGISAGALYNTQIVNNTLRNGGDGINLAGTVLNMTITGNKIDNMTRRYGDGISIMNHDNTSVSSVIANNSVNNTMYGMYLGGYFNGLISGNLLNNSATCAINKTQKMGPGILNATITDNNILNAGIGLYIDNQVTFMNLSNNNISSKQASIQYSPNFVKNGTILIENNNLSGTQTWNIKSTMNNSYIQSLIDGANSGDTISFASGTYNDIKLVINKTLNFVGNGALINGINESSTNIFTVTYNGDADASGSTFKGFEFNLLNNNVTSGGKLTSTGYAINLDGVSNILIENVTSHNGKAAVYNGNANNVLINNCTFTDDYGYCYGYHVMGGQNLTVNNSKISGCADGISMASGANNITVQNSLLLNNIYAAFWGGGVSNITFQNNMINGFYEGLGIEKSASQTYVINNTFVNGWGNNSAQKASGDAIYIKNSYAHGPLSIIDDIQIIGNTFQNITGAAVGVDNQAGQGLFTGNGTGNSIVGINNTVNNVSKGYVVLYSQGQNLNFTLDSSTPQAQPLFANLSISTAVNNNTIKTGGSTTYTVTVKNTGTGNATNIIVSNILNTLFFSSSQAYSSIGNYANGIWNIGSLSAGNTASLVVTATAIKSGVATSQATVTSDTTTPVKAKTIQKTINKDVSVKIINSISTSNAKVGSYVYLRTNVTNSGKDISDPMTFGMTLPSGVSTVSTNYPVQWNNKTKLWTLSVPSGKSIVLTTKVKVTTKGTKTVTFNNNGKKVTKSFKVS